MRVEPYGLDSIVHVVKRGARGLDIVKDGNDRRDFANLLFHLNDTHNSVHWRREIAAEKPFTRPRAWPERFPLVKILAWTLMPNHFHLILQTSVENGISKFMQRLCGSMSLTFNAKYAGTGSIFQGGYKGRIVKDEDDLRYLTSYVLVKNVFELLPGGLAQNVADFEKAWITAAAYEYSSFATLALEHSSPIVEVGQLRDLFPSPAQFKRDSQDMLHAYLERKRDGELYGE